MKVMTLLYSYGFVKMKIEDAVKHPLFSVACAKLVTTPNSNHPYYIVIDNVKKKLESVTTHSLILNCFILTNLYETILQRRINTLAK